MIKCNTCEIILPANCMVSGCCPTCTKAIVESYFETILRLQKLEAEYKSLEAWKNNILNSPTEESRELAIERLCQADALKPFIQSWKECLRHAAFHLDWMIKDFDFRNSETGMEKEDSPEMKSARELLDMINEQVR